MTMFPVTSSVRTPTMRVPASRHLPSRSKSREQMQKHPCSKYRRFTFRRVPGYTLLLTGHGIIVEYIAPVEQVPKHSDWLSWKQLKVNMDHETQTKTQPDHGHQSTSRIRYKVLCRASNHLASFGIKIKLQRRNIEKDKAQEISFHKGGQCPMHGLRFTGVANEME
jgi:hypothetical protein